MNNNFGKVFAFAIGAAIGSVVTWKLVKTKYEKIANEEIESVKEVFSRRNSTDTKEAIEKILEEHHYATESSEKEEEGDTSSDDDLRPYVIKPEDFGEHDGYDTVTYTCYKDGVLEDDWGELMEDVDDIIGLDSLNHFGEYEADSVYVRNDRLETDYEILLDEKTYAEVNGTDPRHPDDE